MISRPEPEAYTTHLAALIHQDPDLLHLSSSSSSTAPPKSLRALDLCTGTGCIALLLYSLLSRTIPDLHVHGVDISPQAVRLANENIRYNSARGRLPPSPSPSSSQSLSFSQVDIFSDDFLHHYLRTYPPHTTQQLDILLCNPPYVSQWGFTHQTARSVRHYEPKIAQVPMASSSYPDGSTNMYHNNPEDVFYARLLDIGAFLQPRLMLFEVGDLAQALRVVDMAWRHSAVSSSRVQGQGNRQIRNVEVWRDWPDAATEEGDITVAEACEGSRKVRIKGSGHGRSVFIQYH